MHLLNETPPKTTPEPVLYLVPNTLGFLKTNTVIAEGAIRQIHQIGHFLAESRPSAHRLLKWLKHPQADRDISIEILNKETPAQHIPLIMEPLRSGRSMGVLSEAGMPGIADPGNLAVRWAHSKGFRVSPLTGPSSLFLALAASGLNGQKFSFHGYLPDVPELLKKKIKDLERLSALENATQLFIEAPHRNEATFKSLLANLLPETMLCVATQLTLDEENVITRSVENWKKSPPLLLGKNPTVFLLQS